MCTNEVVVKTVGIVCRVLLLYLESLHFID